MLNKIKNWWKDLGKINLPPPKEVDVELIEVEIHLEDGEVLKGKWEGYCDGWCGYSDDLIPWITTGSERYSNWIEQSGRAGFIPVENKEIPHCKIKHIIKTKKPLMVMCDKLYKTF